MVQDKAFAGKILVLRYTRLERVPPGFYATQLLHESGFPVLVFEFGNEKIDSQETLDFSLPRLQPCFPWLRFLPRAIGTPLSLALAASRLILGILFSGKPKIVVSHGIFEEPLALLLWKLFGIPYVAHVHEIYGAPSDLSSTTRIIHRFERSFLKSAAFLLFPEAGRAKYFIEKYGLTNPSYLVFNCPRLMRSEPVPVDHRRKRLVYLGGVADLNCIVEAIEAVALVPDLEFAIGGWCTPEYRDQLEKLIDSKGLRDRVFIAGYVSDRWKFTASGDIGYCVYRDDRLRTRYITTASNKIMESLSMGLAVLLGPQKGSDDFLMQFPVGLKTPDYGVQSIVTTLRAFLADESKLRHMKEAALRAHREILNFEHQFAPALKAFKVAMGDADVVTPFRKVKSG